MTTITHQKPEETECNERLIDHHRKRVLRGEIDAINKAVEKCWHDLPGNVQARVLELQNSLGTFRLRLAPRREIRKPEKKTERKGFFH